MTFTGSFRLRRCQHFPTSFIIGKILTRGQELSNHSEWWCMCSYPSLVYSMAAQEGYHESTCHRWFGSTCPKPSVWAKPHLQEGHDMMATIDPQRLAKLVSSEAKPRPDRQHLCRDRMQIVESWNKLICNLYRNERELMRNSCFTAWEF